MYTALVLMALLPGTERDRFPAWYEAKEQVERYKVHRAWLRHMRQGRGYDDGRWDEWIKECNEAIDYFEILREWIVQDNRAEQLKRRIGPARYLQGWRPPLIPENQTYPNWPPREPVPPIMPPANP